LGALGERHVHLEGVEDVGHRVPGELDVDDGADDPYDAAGPGPGLCSRSSHHTSLPAAASAFAPPTISLISWVIAACRAEFMSRVYFLINSSALSVALFSARRRAADSLAAESSNAANRRVLMYLGSSASSSSS